MPAENLGQNMTQWITLFDDTEDDEYDGDFGEDDEELPMIRVNFNAVKDDNEPPAALQSSPAKSISNVSGGKAPADAKNRSSFQETL